MLTAAAIKCLNGEIQARLVFDPERLGVDKSKVPPADEVIERLKSMGITDPNKVYDTDDLAPGKKIIFAATGVTDGALMRGVRFFGSGKRTHSLVMTSESKHIRFVDSIHIEGGPDTVIRFLDSNSDLLISTVNRSSRNPLSNRRTSRRRLSAWPRSIGLALFLLVVAAPVAAANGLSHSLRRLTKPSVISAINFLNVHFISPVINSRSARAAQVCTRDLRLRRSLFRGEFAEKTDTPPIIWLLFSIVPLVIDFALRYFGVWQNNHFTRVTTGALFGAVAAIYVVPGLIELSANVRRRFKSEPPAE